MATDENVSVYNFTWPISSYPGDNICPTTPQFHETARASYELWSTLGSDMRDDVSISCTADCILDLLRYVPAFSMLNAQRLSPFLTSPFFKSSTFLNG